MNGRLELVEFISMDQLSLRGLKGGNDMKKRTLNQTWTLCLRMWRWIIKMKAEGSRKWIFTLKKQWLRENRIKIVGDHDCFFCEFNDDVNNRCERCPGTLVNSNFSCCNLMYHYAHESAAFYKELLRLNRIRKER